MVDELALPILTERLVLRRYQPTDADAVLAYRGDPDVVRYMPHEPWSPQDAVTKIADWSENRAALSVEHPLALAVEFEGAVIGDVVLMAADPTLLRLEIGWCFHPDFQGRGLAGEAAAALLDVAFGHYGARRVFAQLDPRNTASAKLCSRLGMTHEAFLRGDWHDNHGWSDNSVYGLLATDPRPRADAPRLPTPKGKRPALDLLATDRDALEEWLEFYRDTLLRKVGGLTAAELCRATVPPSALTLGGLVRHLTMVEQVWFALTAGGLSEPLHYAESGYGGDFREVNEESALRDVAFYRSEVERMRGVAAGVTDLDAPLPGRRHGKKVNLRWVYLHMIEEYARHLGHADLVRERLDGSTGY